MYGIKVNPMTVREGQQVATKYAERWNGNIEVFKSREVKHVAVCSKPENVHIDGECFDSRFSTVVIAKGK